MKSVLSWLALMMGLVISAGATAQNHTVFLVRHAEKSSEPATDPALSEPGMRRAEVLADLLANAKPAVLFATQYQRTQMTAKPLADKIGVGITVLPVEKGALDYPQQLLDRICVLPADASVLVVGHSNTIPAIAEAWTTQTIRPMTEDEYNRILIIKLKDCRAVEFLELHF